MARLARESRGNEIMATKRQKAAGNLANLAAHNEPPSWLRPLVEQIIRECVPAASHPPRLIELPELLKLVPLSERTIRASMRRGWIPHIRLPGARRILFDPEAVHASLRRFEHGGLE